MTGPVHPSPVGRPAAVAALLALLALPWLHPVHGPAPSGVGTVLEAGLPTGPDATVSASACVLCQGRAQARHANPPGRALVPAPAPGDGLPEAAREAPKPKILARSTAAPRAPPASHPTPHRRRA